MRTFQSDYKFGIEKESAVLDAIKVFDPTLTKTSQYHPFDFAGKTAFVELKSRNNRKDKYPTTMISQSKIEYAKKNGGVDYIFCFLFQDGLYYIKYDECLFKEFEVSSGGRCDRGRVETNVYCFIPVDKLCPLIY